MRRRTYYQRDGFSHSHDTQGEEARKGANRCGDKTATMPLRTSTRAQKRAHRIAAERRHNRQARQTEGRQCQAACFGPAPRSIATMTHRPFGTTLRFHLGLRRPRRAGRAATGTARVWLPCVSLECQS